MIDRLIQHLLEEIAMDGDVGKCQSPNCIVNSSVCPHDENNAFKDACDSGLEEDHNSSIRKRVHYSNAGTTHFPFPVNRITVAFLLDASSVRGAIAATCQKKLFVIGHMCLQDEPTAILPIPACH